MAIVQGTDANDELHGTDHSDDFQGGGGDDVLYGYEGNDHLNGGVGADTMYGGSDHDTYVVDNVADQVIENESGGTDTVLAFSDFQLGSYVERLFYMGSSDFYGIGNELDNFIQGAAGNDVLDGGLGADLLQGHGGNDIYMVDEAGDDVVELADEGTDKVYVYLNDYTLGTDIEELAYWGPAGLSFTGTGNALNNVILGGGGNDFLYGLSGNDFLIGSGGDDLLAGGAGADQMVGGAGNDTYAVDDAADLVQESAGEGSDTVESSLSLTLSANVENLVLLEGSAAIDGTGNALANSIIGNSAANRLEGGGGNDVLEGGLGSDTMVGGDGDDSYHVDETGDQVIENTGEGTDTVRVSLSEYALGHGVEHLIYTGPTTADFTGVGNALDNYIEGAGGNDLFVGGAGADTLVGNGGDDTYYIDDAGDRVVENAGEGADQVFSSLTAYTLGENVENLTLAAGAINGDGNALANLIVGNDAGNRLDGSGGADRMEGGDGDDIYVVDDSGDVVVEAGFVGGEDLVFSSVDFTLGSYLDNLTLTGSDDIDATGNTLDNRIVGNAGANVIDGGRGSDTMSGGAGDDGYYVNSGLDQIIENAGEGTDTVYALMSQYTLGADVERLVYAGPDGSPFTGTGNGLDNEIAGGSGDDELDGGAGADRLAGGRGHDSYTVDDAGDEVVEAEGEGRDTVISSVSFTLGAHVENLILLDGSAIDGTGNTLANSIVGNSAANRLDGGGGNDMLDGGLGTDTMAGGAGDDNYQVDDAGDQVLENAGEGTDSVRVSLSSFVLGANVESLIYNGTSTADFSGLGNALDNFILSSDGNDVLDGGLGGDLLIGGGGDETYHVDDARDGIIENAGEGTDTVHVALSQYWLGEGVERLIYAGPSTSAFFGVGNGLDNYIQGGDSYDTLEGGLGADTLVGKGGDDAYYVDDAGDQVVENAGEGTDQVFTSLSAYTLGENVEYLFYYSLSGGAFAGTGNALDNYIQGGDSNDVLDGGLGADRLIGGAGNDTLIGGLGNDQLEGGAGADRMAGGGGDDVYYFVEGADVVEEQAGEGTDWVYTSASAYSLAANIENLIYTGPAESSFTGTGNDLDNWIIGADRKDVLDGGLGADMLIGRRGDDTYRVDNLGDVVQENDGEGLDLVQSSVSHALYAFVENLTLTGGADIDAIGNGLANFLTGNSGDNLLDGGAGMDKMAGGLGDDVYHVDTNGDRVYEQLGGGDDLVIASANFTLLDHIERLTLTGNANLSGGGNGLANVLSGNAGANLLDGKGGADTMDGHGGNDTYIVDNMLDQVSETGAGGGTDLVKSSVNYTLGANIENLTLTGGATNGTGNGHANRITGNQGANRLDGGAGADTLIGGGGNDVYVIGAADTVVEAAGGGIDTVEIAISYRLGANLESLVLTGSGNIDGTGNSAANTLSGNDGNNVLNGGFGPDIMAGGLGDDTYVVNDVNDIATEFGGGGIDNVQSSVSFTLGADIEDLKITGSGNVNATGNDLDNIIGGHVGANVLIGRLGNDTLKGGGGADSFVFDTALGDGNVDRILDFSSAADTIQLDGGIFAAVGLGTLDADAFHKGTAAADAEDRIIYDQATGNIFYDADGNGAGEAILFATINPGSVTHLDFMVI